MNSGRIRIFAYLRGTGDIPALTSDDLRDGTWLRTYARKILISPDTVMFLFSGVAVGLLAEFFAQIESDGESDLLAFTAVGFAALAVALTALAIFVSFVNDTYLRILGTTRKGRMAGYVIPYLAAALISSAATTVGAVGALVYKAVPDWLRATILGLEVGLVVWSAWAVFQIIIEVASHGLNRYDITMAIQENREDPIFERLISEDSENGEADPDRLDTLRSQANLASAYQEVGQPDEAIPLFEEILPVFERVLGPDDPDTLRTRNNLALAYRDAGRLGKAIPLFEQTLADRERVLGSDDPDTLRTRNNLALAYRDAGRLDKAIPLFEQTLADRQRVLGPDDPDTLTSRANLASAYQRAGRSDEAIRLREQTLADRERVLGSRRPRYPAHAEQSRSRLSGCGAARQGDPAVRADASRPAARAGPRRPRHPDLAGQSCQRLPESGAIRRGNPPT